MAKPPVDPPQPLLASNLRPAPFVNILALNRHYQDDVFESADKRLHESPEPIRFNTRNESKINRLEMRDLDALRYSQRTGLAFSKLFLSCGNLLDWNVQCCARREFIAVCWPLIGGKFERQRIFCCSLAEWQKVFLGNIKFSGLDTLRNRVVREKANKTVIRHRFIEFMGRVWIFCW